MNTMMIIGIIISVILGLCSFVASNNIIVGVVCLTLSILYFSLLARPLFGKYQTKIKRFNECYHFINNFIVSLSIKEASLAAFESTMSTMPESFIAEIENIETFSLEEKLEHLNKYFRFHIFALFISLIKLYEEQGGNILDMSHYLLEETRQEEEYISSSVTIAKNKILEFVVLWLLTLGIMVFMRFSLSQFFATISKQLFYPIGIGAIVLFCLGTIHLAIVKVCSVKIKGWDDNEKI